MTDQKQPRVSDIVIIKKSLRDIFEVSRKELRTVLLLDPGSEAPLNEFKSMPLLQRIGCFSHLATAELIVHYLLGVPSQEDLLAEEPSNGENSDSIKSLISSTVTDWKKFLKAASLTPIYAIPVLFFVLFTGVLNILSYYMRSAPMIRKYWTCRYRLLTRSYSDPRWIRDFTLNTRPLFLSWSLLIPPFAILMMIINTITCVFKPLVKPKASNKVYGWECVRFPQNKAPQGIPSNFYFSPWFPLVTMIPFVLGIPTAISLWIYLHLGVDALLNYPSHVKEFFSVFVIIDLYLASLGCCLCTLFFRSYFSFPMNFCSTEYDIEIYDDVIKSLPIKGWFADFFTMRLIHMPTEIRWIDVSTVKYSGGSLKTDLGKSENAIVSHLKKITSIYESLANKLNIHTETLQIISKTGRGLDIHLWELTAEQKLELFHLLRKNAPSLYLDENVQHALTGSTVLREPKYTEIWFSVLKGDSTNFREGDLEEGRSLRDDRYHVKSKLASGGQAVVYLAVDDKGRTVVLKEFQLTTGESLDVQIESAKDFENESAILDQLSHPSIVKSLDIFYEEGRIYLVLENVEGQSLRQLVSEKGVLSSAEILGLAEQMCDILKYLHDQIPPVVHRDFTPDNIILQPDGRLKLIDFSVAQHKKDPNSTDCAGKHSYTPPEQFRGAAIPQSDIYALGATLYFMATGIDPVPISTSQLPATDLESTNLLSKIISGATELDLGKRYESIEWLLLALQQSTAAPESIQFKMPTTDPATALQATNSYRGPRIQINPDKEKVHYAAANFRRRI